MAAMNAMTGTSAWLGGFNAVFEVQSSHHRILLSRFPQPNNDLHMNEVPVIETYTSPFITVNRKHPISHRLSTQHFV